MQSPALTSDNSTNTMAGRFEKLEVRVDTPRGLTDQMVGPEREHSNAPTRPIKHSAGRAGGGEHTATLVMSN